MNASFMRKRLYKVLGFLMVLVTIGCNINENSKNLAHQITSNKDFIIVKNKAKEVIKTGFNA